MENSWILLNKSLDNSEIVDPGLRFSGLFTVALNVATVVAFGVSFVMFAYSFIQFITSTGDPKRLEKPKNAIFWSAIGMVLALMLQGIKHLIKDFLGVQTDSIL